MKNCLTKTYRKAAAADAYKEANMKDIIIFMIEFYTIWILGCMATDWLLGKIKNN